MSKTTILIWCTCAGIAAIAISVLFCFLAAIIVVFANLLCHPGASLAGVDFALGLMSPARWGITALIFAVGSSGITEGFRADVHWAPLPSCQRKVEMSGFLPY
jgi:hypothetical protein